jgi:hypothetical protein
VIWKQLPLEKVMLSVTKKPVSSPSAAAHCSVTKTARSQNPMATFSCSWRNCQHCLNVENKNKATSITGNGDLASKLTVLLEKRNEHYNSFPLKLHVDGKTAEQNAYKAQVALGRHHLSAMGEYDVLL